MYIIIKFRSNLLSKMRKGPDRPQKGADQLRTEVSHRERRLHDPDPQRFNVYTQ